MGRVGAGVLGGLVVLGSGYVFTLGALLVSGFLFSWVPTGLWFVASMTVLGTLGVLLAAEVGDLAGRRTGIPSAPPPPPGLPRSLLAYGAGVAVGLLPLAFDPIRHFDFHPGPYLIAPSAGLLVARAILRTGISRDGAGADRVGDAGGHGRPRGALPCVLEESPGSTGQDGG